MTKIGVQLKLKLKPRQERELSRWLWMLTGAYNWAIRKIELDARDGIYWSNYDLEGLTAWHSGRLGLPTAAISHTVRTAHAAWHRCFKKLVKRPRLKGKRNRLNSIPLKFDDGLKPSARACVLPKLGRVSFHKQFIPTGRIATGRLVKRSSGWHLCLVVGAEPNAIPITADGTIGIDPGFATLATLSTGEKINHPHEFKRSERREGQAERGRRSRLVARLRERVANQRRDRNHKLSRRLVSENAIIVWSKDGSNGLSRTFGKSVSSAGHYQLRNMLAYKCRSGGRRFVEVSSRNSTKTCSACGALSGPTGYAGLSVRRWTCVACGAVHDRDINAAINTLNAGLGTSLERTGDGSSGIANDGTRRGSCAVAEARR